MSETKITPAVTPLSVEAVVADLIGSTEDTGGWYKYRAPISGITEIGTQRLLHADQYNLAGEVIATHNIWIEIEIDERMEQPE